VKLLVLLLLFARVLIAGDTPLPGKNPIVRPDWASSAGVDKFGAWADFIMLGVTQRFRRIDPGTFIMGSPENEEGRQPGEVQHQVTITAAYWMADSSCSQEFWLAVMGSNPSHFMGNLDRPVENVSWHDCQKFLSRLSEHTKNSSGRLPTEAEWEYACRANSLGPINCRTLLEGAWYGSNSDFVTHPGKQKAPNSWGLYDMHGNVWNWCSDWETKKYEPNAVTNPTGPMKGMFRVVRGGSYQTDIPNVRSAYRQGWDPKLRLEYLGLRICISP
jgi:formylglycine-generating enzyme required for sulfatase activity